MLMLNAWCRC